MNDTQEHPKDLQEVVKFAEKRFNEISPAGLNFSKEANFAIQILKNNAYLMGVAKGCPRSLVDALTNVAAIGLSLNPASKEAYLIPRNIKVNDNTWESRLFLEPSYMGLNKVATDTGSIDWVQARVARKEDTFVDNGVGVRPTHTYDAFGTNESRGDIIGAYCVAKCGDDYLTNIMNKEKLDSIRGRSETWKKSVAKGDAGAGTWFTDPEEMCKKAAMRQGFKTWTKTDKFARLEQAVHLSNENEGFEPMVSSPEIKQSSGEQKEFLDALITNNDHVGMFCFMTSLEEGVQTSLYHSFQKGEKGKYQKIIRELQERGRSEIYDCKAVIQQAKQDGDDMACKELLEDLPQEAIDWIVNDSDQEVGQFIRECMND